MTAADRKILAEAGPFHLKYEAHWQNGSGWVIRPRRGFVPTWCDKVLVAATIERLLNEAARPKGRRKR